VAARGRGFGVEEFCRGDPCGLPKDGRGEAPPLRGAKMIKAIIFDLGGVLMTDVPLKEIAEDLSKRHTLPAEEIWAYLYPREHWELLTLGKITEDEYWDDFLKASKISEKLETRSEKSEVRSQKLKKELKKKVRSSLYPLEHTPRIISLLKDHYKLAILSNHSKEWSKYMRQKFDLFQSFDPIIFSCDVGFRKPDPKVYEIALEKLKCGPEECLFIDDKKRNTDAGEKLGMKGVVFESPLKLEKALSGLGVKMKSEEGGM
jgi:epoxide hydrolase-like predicted phosphatase